ncbi:unnamed protein product [Strongylus vulgaris]|uniref:Uncharacterized protein n=1 Tax=Strongylus vulgaris TaxID=40348 RepID=A0A3P7IZW3_STRVU|nr:unnamed protein product [Strongylus vulgaris]
MPHGILCLAQHITLWLLVLPGSFSYPSKVIIKSFTTSFDEAHVAVQALQFAADEINTGPEAPFRLGYDHYDVETGSSEGWSVVNKGEFLLYPLLLHPRSCLDQQRLLESQILSSLNIDSYQSLSEESARKK